MTNGRVELDKCTVEVGEKHGALFHPRTHHAPTIADSNIILVQIFATIGFISRFS